MASAPPDSTRETALATLVADIRACRVCRDAPTAGKPLPHEPRPVLQVSATARICLAGQAPGTRVHASGRPYTDPSGDRLRTWLGIGSDVFYDASRVSVVPMGFCFPGLDAHGGDLPPRRECRPLWHDRLFALLPNVRLVLAIGAHAQRYHIPGAGGRVSETVEAWRSILARSRAGTGPAVLPLPHPSWRNSAWLKRNPWFEAELIPVLRSEVAAALAETDRPDMDHAVLE
ncbi:MAG: uracil-DNA glycosylase family protein [Bauldia sp.]|nr:uracil-DNA glycosylase family protein [Bauldia sp.]